MKLNFVTRSFSVMWDRGDRWQDVALANDAVRLFRLDRAPKLRWRIRVTKVGIHYLSTPQIFEVVDGVPSEFTIWPTWRHRCEFTIKISGQGTSCVVYSKHDIAYEVCAAATVKFSA